jgi:glycosyltransferase involved in cell wall biosynthesis
METAHYSRLVMLGAAPGTRGAIAPVVEAYRAGGLLKRWPIAYIATHGDGGFVENARLVLKGLRAFAGTLARERSVIVHAHCGTRAGLWRQGAFIALAAAARCPVIVHLHGGGFERLYDAASAPARAVIRFVLSRAACVIAPTESLRAWARSVAREAYVVCVPPLVTVQPACPKVGPEVKRQNLILVLGTLEAGKGIVDLLQAVASLRPAIPDVRLVCASEGDRAGVARHAERLGIRDVVKFVGRVGPSGKRTLLENAAAFVLPPGAEGLPVSLLEAMAAGVPVIASPAGGVPEVVVDGVSGFLVAPGDVAALSRLLRKLLLERALGARLGAAARESVRLRFAPERGIARLEEIYAAAGLSASGEPRIPRRQEGLREAA